jgi:hypothetical protein
VIVGSRERFGIESQISVASPDGFERSSGYFVIYLGGKSYGVKEADASMLGCSFEEVRNRLGERGTHSLPFLSDLSAAAITDAFLDAIYRNSIRDSYLGVTKSQFIKEIHGNHIQWAPDGDAAFDDGSFVLQFDIQDKVRLIAFKNMECPIEAASSVAESWIEADEFYGILSEWSDLFTADWNDQLRTGDPKDDIA